MSGGFGLGFGETDAGDLWPAVGTARHLIFIQWFNALDAGNFLNADNRFVAGLVGEPGWTCNVAYSIEAGEIGFAKAIGLQESALSVSTFKRFKAEVFNIAGNTDGENHLIEFKMLLALGPLISATVSAPELSRD